MNFSMPNTKTARIESQKMVQKIDWQYAPTRGIRVRYVYD